MPAERKDDNAQFFTTTDIMIRLEDFSKKTSLRNVGIALKKLKYQRSYYTVNERQTKGYFVFIMNNKI
jgi:hypothetical protein